MQKDKEIKKFHPGGGVKKQDRLSLEEEKIALENIEEILKVFYKIRKKAQFVDETIGHQKMCQYRNKHCHLTKIPVRKVCNKLNINEDDFIHKKIKVDLQFMINIGFEN